MDGKLQFVIPTLLGVESLVSYEVKKLAGGGEPGEL